MTRKNRNTRKNNTPQDWQKDASRIETSRVQYWRNGIMLTGEMTPAQAREMVNEGTAFVISGGAIGALVNGQYAS